MKATASTLSEHLLAEARRFMGYPGLVRRGRSTADLWDKKLLPAGARTQEWIVPKGKGFALPDCLLNEYYSKTLLEEVPGFVAWAAALTPVECAGQVPRQVNVYLEQATRSFVVGLWDGAVALARACLEEAFEDRIGHHIGHQKRELFKWIAAAERKRLISPAQLGRLKTIQALGNRVLHEASATEAEALKAISSLRDALRDFYR
jgi:hypothetical protein